VSARDGVAITCDRVRFAGEGICFTRAHPATLPARSALLRRTSRSIRLNP
jgi:hypothetical protein